MSSVYLIDYYSNITKSVIHQITAASKIIFLLLVLFSIVISKSFLNLFLIFLIIILLITVAKIPLLKILKWTIYPAFFASLFALSQIQYGLLPLQTMLRAVDAALLVIFIICTTPYPAIFSLLGKISPFLANLFFMTYRDIFLIIDKIQTKMKMLKVRGGYSGGITKTFKNLGLMIGHFLVYSLEKSEQLYSLLLVRGYRGLMSLKVNYKFGLLDLLLIALGNLILLIILIVE